MNVFRVRSGSGHSEPPSINLQRGRELRILHTMFHVILEITFSPSHDVAFAVNNLFVFRLRDHYHCFVELVN